MSLLNLFFNRSKITTAETAKQRLSIIVHTDGVSNEYTMELQEVVKRAVYQFHIDKGLDVEQIENLHYAITDEQLLEVQIPIPVKTPLKIQE